MKSITEEDTKIKIRVKSWTEMVSSADYVSKKGLHIGGFVFKKSLLARFIASKEIKIQMTMFGIWEAVDYKAKHRNPFLVLLSLICDKNEENRAEEFLKNKFSKNLRR